MIYFIITILVVNSIVLIVFLCWEHRASKQIIELFRTTNEYVKNIDSNYAEIKQTLDMLKTSLPYKKRRSRARENTNDS